MINIQYYESEKYKNKRWKVKPKRVIIIHKSHIYHNPPSHKIKKEKKKEANTYLKLL